jgi:hypothetical protein
MFYTIPIALAIASIAFIGFLLLKSYYPSWFGEVVEVFTPLKKAGGGGPNITINMAAPLAAPAPAPVIKETPVEEPPRVVAAATAAPPNAAPPPLAPTPSPDVKAFDPYDEHSTEAPIGDSMRYPERSFGPGLNQLGAGQAVGAGVASTQANVNLSPFAPEAVQSGGNFFQGVAANDLSGEPEYAEA